jgi:S-adenosylmethionine:tRNA ribosyltransferase-isomerase
MLPKFTLSDFDYRLPSELIAQHPAPQRSASRLLDGTGQRPVDRVFGELPELLQPGDLLVFNDTKVIKARLLGTKASGGAVEALIERVLSDHQVLAKVRASKSPKPGSKVAFVAVSGERFKAEVLGRAGPENSLFRLRFPGEPFALLERFGHVPLPPYITRGSTGGDEQRYQSVFASKPGAVAAPTAALHFDESVLARLAIRGVGMASITLHVGAGTFQPVRAENLAEHKMHSEWFDVNAAAVAAIDAARLRGGRVVAVGTTTLRALESAARPGPESAGLQADTRETDIFITPGFDFRVVDVLVTNFHLPKSTLLMLVSAFSGHERVMAFYEYAIAQRYRFYSYGDAMFLTRK